MGARRVVEVSGNATFKARDVEELIDFYLHRRAANWVVRLVAPTGIMPNQVTIASGCVGIAAGLIVGTASTPWQLALGMAAFFLAIVLDCSDGQLARLRGTSSFAGRALDGWVDTVAIASVFFGQFAFMVRQGSPFWITFAAGWAAGASLKWQAHNYDHMKNLYLLNTEAEEKGTDAYPSLEAIEAERQEHLRAGRHFYAAIVRSYASFVKNQRKAEMKRGSELRAKTDTERALYRRVHRLHMRLWTFEGVGTHLFLMTAATGAAVWVPAAPFYIWVFFVGPASLYTLFLLTLRNGLDARYDRERLALGPEPVSLVQPRPRAPG